MWKKIKNIFNVRNLPHPEYGNYGGANRRCQSHQVERDHGVCPPPVDELDKQFVLHDYDTGNKDDVFADWKLVGRLARINPFDNNNYADQVYGRVYQAGAITVMGIVGLLTTPFRLTRRALGS